MSLFSLSLLGGLIVLDGSSFGQFMLARPLVSGAIAGWAMGDLSAGITVGLVLEAFLLPTVPAGGARFAEAAPGGVVGGALAAQTPGAEGVALGVFFGIAFCLIGGVSIVGLRRANRKLLSIRSEEDPISGLRRRHFLGILMDFLRGAMVIGLGLFLGSFALMSPGFGWPLGTAATLGMLGVVVAIWLGVLFRQWHVGVPTAWALIAGLAGGVVGGWIL